MKKIFLGILLFAVLCVPLSACGDEWVLTQIRIDTENAADIEASVLNKTGILQLNQDGSAMLSATDIGNIVGTWEKEEENIVLTSEDDQVYLLSQTDAAIEMKTTGLILIFTAAVPVKAEIFSPPNAITASSAEQFFGRWQAQWCIAGSLTVNMTDVDGYFGFVIDQQHVQLERADRKINIEAHWQNGVLALPDLEAALALDDDGSLSMVQGEMTFFLYPVHVEGEEQ